MDIVDLAQLQAIEIKPKPLDLSAPSYAECDICGDDIPPQRQAYGAVKHCIICQDLLDRGRI